MAERPWGFESPLAHVSLGYLIERRPHKSLPQPRSSRSSGCSQARAASQTRSRRLLDPRAERQSRTATVGRVASKGTTTVELSDSIPGEPDETADVAVEVGPVEYEKITRNNTLKGTVTFGL